MNRRGFLRTSAATAGGLLVGFCLPETSKLAADTAGANARLSYGSLAEAANTPGISRRFAEATLQPGAVGRTEGDAAVRAGLRRDPAGSARPALRGSLRRFAMPFSRPPASA